MCREMSSFSSGRGPRVGRRDYRGRSFLGSIGEESTILCCIATARRISASRARPRYHAIICHAFGTRCAVTVLPSGGDS